MIGPRDLPTPRRTPSVLLVDDEPEIAVSLRRALERGLPAVEVHWAMTHEDGLRMLRDEAVDVVVCDHDARGPSGIQFLSEARRIAPGVVRVLMPAYPERDTAIRAINEAQPQYFLAKPFTMEEATRVLAALLRKAQAERPQQEAWDRTIAGQESRTDGAPPRAHDPSSGPRASAPRFGAAREAARRDAQRS